MEIANLTIEGFRGIREGNIRFGPHTVLIGANNCGKTTIIEAIALLFGRDRMVRSLTEHDFYGSCPQPADRIRLIATVVGFPGDDPADHGEWFREGRAVVKWWNHTANVIAATRDQPDWRLACQIAFIARFDRPSLEVETLRYFFDGEGGGDPFTEEATVPVPARLIRDLGFFLVPASRTWDRVMSFGSELFRRVVASAAGQPAESVIAERDRLRTPAQPLEADAQLAPIVTRVNEELSGFFRSRPRLELRVTATDSDGLLEAVVPHYRHDSAALGLPARRHGSGLISLQHLLLLLQFGRQRAANGDGFWMALEEPELHVPPPLQRRLIYRIQALSTQTFLSTHSPMIAAISNPETVSVMRNEDGHLFSTPLLAAPLPTTTPNAIRKLFQINRIETITALMHDALLVPEGTIDYAWIKLLSRATDLDQDWTAANECLFSSHIGIIPTHDAAVALTVATLSRLHPRIAALVDGDQDGINYSASLIAAPAPPTIILRWPDGWTIENVVGWILEADAPAALREVGAGILPAPASIAILVTRLTSMDRATHGLKQDHIAYDSIASAIGTIPACRARARSLLNSIAENVLGTGDPLFEANPGESPMIRVLRA